jgi:hypothetical protein
VPDENLLGILRADGPTGWAGWHPVDTLSPGVLEAAKARMDEQTYSVPPSVISPWSWRETNRLLGRPLDAPVAMDDLLAAVEIERQHLADRRRRRDLMRRLWRIRRAR